MEETIGTPLDVCYECQERKRPLWRGLCLLADGKIYISFLNDDCHLHLHINICVECRESAMEGQP